MNMEEIVNQILSAISCKLYYSALFMTVTIPDICSALQSEDNVTNGKRYKEWIDKYLTPIDENKYGESGQLKSEHLYNIRCSLLHQEQTNDEDTNKNRKGDYKRMLFIEPGHKPLGLNIPFHCCIVGFNTPDKSLLIDIVKFCNDIIKATKQWLKDVENNKFYKINCDRLIKRHPNGVAPIFGISVIG